MASKLTRDEAFSLLDGERDFQERNVKQKGFAEGREVASWIALMHVYVEDAFRAYRGSSSDEAALDIIRKIGGLAVACIEEHGAPPRQS